jgi:ubiquinone/menaquinone biosynthesis C-methylase UbiE
METKNKKGKGHGNPWIVGVLGIILAIALYLHLPQLKVVSGAVLLFSLAHLVIGGLILVSAYLVSPQKLIYLLFEKRRIQKMEGKYYFGWSFGWMNLFWITASIFMMAAIMVYLINPQLIWFSLILFLISLNLWAGNFTLRASKNQDYMTLPLVDLVASGDQTVLDAGCGSGRTTLALSKVLKTAKIKALDRFDSDYIENGGKALLERNLKIAGILDNVEICQGDVTAMEFKDNSFDFAISCFMMDHLGKNKLDALREVNRVLKPGSRFLLIVFVPSYATFSVFNVLCFTLTSRKGWRYLFKQSNFSLKEEGVINSAIYFLIEKPSIV